MTPGYGDDGLHRTDKSRRIIRLPREFSPKGVVYTVSELVDLKRLEQVRVPGFIQKFLRFAACIAGYEKYPVRNIGIAFFKLFKYFHTAYIRQLYVAYIQIVLPEVAFVQSIHAARGYVRDMTPALRGPFLSN